KNLHVLETDGTDPAATALHLREAVEHVRSGGGPALIRVTVPRLCGHSGQDTQAYKTERQIEEEKARDPLTKLRRYLVPGEISEKGWKKLEESIEKEARQVLQAALDRPQPDPTSIRRHVFCEFQEDGSPDIQRQGGLAAEGHVFPSA